MNYSTDWPGQIRRLPSNKRAVAHEPETARYAKARAKHRYLINEGTYLGFQRTPGRQTEIEVAVWAPPDTGRGYGHYGCFRVFVKDGEVLSSVLFCYYVGTEASPGFRSLEKAQALAKQQGFVKGDTNG